MINWRELSSCVRNDKKGEKDEKLSWMGIGIVYGASMQMQCDVKETILSNVFEKVCRRMDGWWMYDMILYEMEIVLVGMTMWLKKI